MITIRDMLNAGIDFQAAENTVKHWNDENDEYDVEVELSDICKEGAQYSELLDMEVTYIYPAGDGQLVIEVHERG